MTSEIINDTAITVCVMLVYKCVPARDVQNNSTSHPQFEMIYFILPSYVHYPIPGKVKLQQVKLFYCCIVTSSSNVILHLPPEKTNLQLILHITKYYNLPGKLNLQQNCLLVVMVPIMCVLHLPQAKLKVMLVLHLDI